MYKNIQLNEKSELIEIHTLTHTPERPRRVNSAAARGVLRAPPPRGGRGGGLGGDTGQVFRANERAPGGSERERQRARAVRGGDHRAGVPRQRARAGRQRAGAPASASGSSSDPSRRFPPSASAGRDPARASVSERERFARLPSCRHPVRPLLVSPWQSNPKLQ